MTIVQYQYAKIEVPESSYRIENGLPYRNDLEIRNFFSYNSIHIHYKELHRKKLTNRQCSNKQLFYLTISCLQYRLCLTTSIQQQKPITPPHSSIILSQTNHSHVSTELRFHSIRISPLHKSVDKKTQIYFALLLNFIFL